MVQRWWPWLLLALLGASFWLAGKAPRDMASVDGVTTAAIEGVSAETDAAPTSPSPAVVPPANHLPDFLPPEAHDTIAMVRRGGPFPHRQDGGHFGNREGRLPRQSRGWYREYTVETPGLQHRGGRRIVTGGTPPTQWYYTDDHYDSFHRFDPGPAPP